MTYNAGKPDTNKAAALVWWVLWAALTAGLVPVYLFIATGEGQGLAAAKYLPVFPLALSFVVRWLVLPRFTSRTKAFPLYVVGMALAEGSGTLGMVLVPELRTTYLMLGLLGLAQFVPTFARRYGE